MLGDAIEFLKSEVSPIANELDFDPTLLSEVLRRFGARGFAALKVPSTYGGPGLSEPDFRSFQEECARASGTFAFLQTQHQSAASMLLRSENEELKSVYLPRMVDGTRWVGIGFSQLRRAGPPVMRAQRVDGGYHLDGQVPWVTGFGLFDEFLVGATLPDGQAVFGVVPFRESDAGDGSISFSEVMQLASMEAAQTVSAKLSSWFLPDPKVAFVKPDRWIALNDTINITLQGHFALGCARAGLDVLYSNAVSKPLPFLLGAFEALDREHRNCREAIASAQASTMEETTPERLRLRAWAIDLAVRCAHAAITSSSGAANFRTHAAQRIYREALVFTVSAQTTGIMEETLKRLTREGS